MEFNERLNKKIPNIVISLEKMNKDSLLIEKTIGTEGKNSIYQILYRLRSVLFPNVYNQFEIDQTKMNSIIGNNLRDSALELKYLIEKVFKNTEGVRCENNTTYIDYEQKSEEIVIKLLEKLPLIRKKLQTDIEAAYYGDPAAVTFEEIILGYPSVEAISIHRIAHELYKMDVPVIPRIMSESAHQSTGIDIHPGATIGEHFFIDHGTGVVIGETCTIGQSVKLYQGVTLGAKSFSLDEQGNPVKGTKRHPDIQDNVVIYAGATILGGDTIIGHNSIISGNVWVTNSVPPYSRVYNIQPSPIIKNGHL
ncbi:serine O-acetyltransferase EpsC [Priestia megaterium]